jgi:hypothetical protein
MFVRVEPLENATLDETHTLAVPLRRRQQRIQAQARPSPGQVVQHESAGWGFS